jgi:hypothetical protein
MTEAAGVATLDFAGDVKFRAGGKHADHGFTPYGRDGIAAWSREAKDFKNRPAPFVIHEAK